MGEASQHPDPSSFASLSIVAVGNSNDLGIYKRQNVTIEQTALVGRLKDVVGQGFGFHRSQFNLTFMGRTLRDFESVKSTGVTDGSTVLLYPVPQKKPSEKYDYHTNRSRIVRCLKELYKKRVTHLIRESDVQMNMIREYPHIDGATITLLQNDRLLLKWVSARDMKILDKLAKDFPYLGQLLIKAVTLIPKFSPRKSRKASRESSQPPSNQASSQSPEGIEESDLTTDEQAVANAAFLANYVPPGENFATPPPDPQPGPSGVAQPREQPVTAQMLQSALAATFTEQHEVAFQTFGPQLEVLRNMGLRDDRACIVALVRTEGDIVLALSILFNDQD